MSEQSTRADSNNGPGDGSGRVLRYFACRGRGEALRLALIDSGIAFVDDRVQIDDLSVFQKAKHEPSLGGPFAALPVLRWDGHVLGQTLPIATYLSAQLGYDKANSPEARAFAEMITSCAHLDMQVPYGPLFWSAADQPEAQLLQTARLLLDNLAARTRQLETLLVRAAGDGPYFGGVKPAMGDYFVYESLARACAVFGAAFESRLRDTPRMDALRLAIASRPAIAAYLASGRVPLLATGSPSEPRLRERLAELSL
jgi:glutathione S-transferase